jgi:hypothetical protein
VHWKTFGFEINGKWEWSKSGDLYGMRWWSSVMGCLEQLE